MSKQRISQEHGLGELLRHLVELTDGSSDHWYQTLQCDYRARYTPVMRALADGPSTVKELQKRLAVTQGAVSQTVKLMLDEGLITRKNGKDARQTIVSLSGKGEATLKLLGPHWDAIFEAIRALEQEIDLPLMASLRQSVAAFEETSFADRIRAVKEEAGERPLQSNRCSFFQRNGERYAEFRPHYPESLAASLAALCTNRAFALDVGCGNGQLTHLIADHFEKTLGIDSSLSQLEQATPSDKETYAQQNAVSIDLPNSSVDLIVAAQSAHWFDLDGFYSEVRRLGSTSSIIALVCYGVPYIAHPVNTVFQRGYWQDVHAFWPRSRRHVELGYSDLPFPFDTVEFGRHECRQEMTVGGLIDYITTWSSFELASNEGRDSAFLQYFEQLKAACPEDDVFEVSWPLTVRAGHIHS